MSRNSTKPISPIDFSESPQHDALQLLTLWAPSSYSSRSPILSRALARLTVLFVLLAPLLCGVVLGWSLGREFSTVGKHEVPEAAVTGAIPLPPPPPPPLPPHRLLAPAGGVEDLFAVTNEEKAAAFSSSPTAKAPSMVADDEHHLGLFTCLQAHRDKSLHILGVGDSHGRDLVQSPLVRMGVAHVDKERDWTKTAPGYPHITVSHKYLGRPRTVASASKLDRKCQRTHILLSRGTWDLMKYSTPLSKYYAEVQELARSASAVDDVTSVTFKTVHRFAAPTAELGFFAECTSADIVGAYRRVGACAVAAHNRQAKPNRRVRVFDAWDVTSRWPREAFADDGHHLVGKYLHAVADAFLKTTVCPSSFSSSSFNVSDGIWASSEVSDIEARFGCADLDLHVTAPDDADKMPSVAPVGGDGKLEQYLKLPSRQGCRCMADGDERVNDHCAFGRLFAALASNSSRYFAPHKAAGSTLSHSSQLLRLPLLNHTSSYVHTTSRILSTAHPQGRDVFVLGEAVLEMCVNPRWSHQCLRNLGVTYALSRSGDSSSPVCQCSATTNFTATEWCRAQKQRVDAVATDLLTFLRYMFQRKRPDMLTTVTGAKEKRLREAFAVVGAHDPWTEPYLQAFLHVGCTPEWQRLPLSDRHGRSKLAKAAITLLQANAERHNANAEQTTTQLQGLRALSAAFEL